MWVITYHVVPKPETPHFGEVGGAYVSCWILYAWEDGAENLARYEVEKEWTITEEEERSWIRSEDIPVDDENRQYFEQAVVDGGSFVYHTYPIDDECSDEEDVAPENGTTK